MSAFSFDITCPLAELLILSQADKLACMLFDDDIKDNILLLDLREKAEYDSVHIKVLRINHTYENGTLDIIID